VFTRRQGRFDGFASLLLDILVRDENIIGDVQRLSRTRQRDWPSSAETQGWIAFASTCWRGKRAC